MTERAANDPAATLSLLEDSLLTSIADQCPVLLTEALPQEAMQTFRSVFPHVTVLPPARQTVEGVLEAAANVRVIVATVRYVLDRAFFRSLPASVEVLALYSAGHGHVDLEAARERGLKIINTPNVLADSVADLAMALVLGAARRIVEGLDLMRSGQWTGFSPTLLLGRELRGQVLGIYGMGQIGREISIRAQGFGMNVAYRNRSMLPRELEVGARYIPDEEEFLGCCDVLLLAAPHTPETHKFLNAERIAQMKAGAVVVNVSRGELIDDDALIEALACGHIAAAGLDVFANEPDIDRRYLAMGNVFPLPHIGSATVEARTAMADVLVEGIERILLGEQAQNAL
ncbi:2-hydroxyacid dehydrogenase [Aquamicrobium ahrensii]|uniref:Lactate dehydrogenase-like 2-hydroxyacid dehydrogenase n=1 Tax=Aquamicrobium ahrensii TaxID=469551 RepID=A0ABV2KQL4_9HYPH